ncbi:MAG: cytochrome c [Bacteroidia bacterium]|nr:cytochrome c [Bacteroidia bacterium]
MMHRSSIIIFLAILIVVFISATALVSTSFELEPGMRVSKVLAILGDDDLGHYPDTNVRGVSAERGRQLVFDGIASKPGGGSTRRQSKHFVCTSCHNTKREDPDLRYSDPQARLEYTNEQKMPFLQATSLYGVVNRETFYNGDYEKKYGELVYAARNDIRGAIQLCAVECAQGRKLKNWELESILSFLWTIDLKIEDLNLDEDQYDYLASAIKGNTDQDSAISLVKSRYISGSPAHFGSAYASHQSTEKLTGNSENGKLIYENSCLHCHKERRYSFLNLDDEKITFQHLNSKAGGYGHHSIYQVIRYGVFSKAGKRSYMPQYPLEKLSDQQLKDLESYIEYRAKAD